MEMRGHATMKRGCEKPKHYPSRTCSLLHFLHNAFTCVRFRSLQRAYPKNNSMQTSDLHNTHTHTHTHTHSSRWCLRARKSPYALHLISQKLPQCCLKDSNSRTRTHTHTHTHSLSVVQSDRFERLNAKVRTVSDSIFPSSAGSTVLCSLFDHTRC